MAVRALIDTGPLGEAVRAPGRGERDALRAWLDAFTSAGGEIIIPGIADYELRRELILQGLTASLLRLNVLRCMVRCDPIGNDVMMKAAELWAATRKAGRPTAGREALDGDCILAAHATLARRPWNSVIVLTGNVAHLRRFPGIDARRWQDVDPADP